MTRLQIFAAAVGVFAMITATNLCAQVARFPIPASDLCIVAKTRPGAVFDVTGQRAAIIGRENGRIEAWIFPFLILRDLSLQYRFDTMPAPDDLSHYLDRIEVFPDHTTLVYSHPLFTLRQHMAVPNDVPGIIILLEIDTHRGLELFVQFKPALQPMWPAGLGGQYAFWQKENRAYVISESRRRFNAMIGSPGAVQQSPPLAHELAQKPNLFKLRIAPQAARENVYPVLIAADFTSRQRCQATYRAMLDSLPTLWQANHQRTREFLQHTLSLHGSEFDTALAWNKLALHSGFICNPDLGCGMVAGFGPSGISRRPGFAWYFGGDAFINSFAMCGYGDVGVVKRSFEFLQKRQRADGKMMHELSQSAGLLDWFGDYPYGYIHGDTTPYYLAALANYVQASADTAFVRASWPSIEKAYRWCRSTDSNADGLMENTLAGLGASELGSLREASGVDIFLAGIGVQAWKSVAEMAALLHKPQLAAGARQWFETGRANLQKKFWNADSQRYNFSNTQKGNPNPELTAWSAFPIAFDLLPALPARAALVDLASHKISTDWGSRMLASTSAAYDPLAYNNGAVWPFLTGFVIEALYRQHNAEAALQTLRNLANWLGEDALGRMPEVASGAYFRALDTSVPHQLFSSAGFVSGLIRGMLGLRLDAPNRTLYLAPHLPAMLDSLRIENLIVGTDTLSLVLKQSFSSFEAEVIRQPRRPVTVDLQPAFGPFARLQANSGSPGLEIETEPTAMDTHFRLQFRTDRARRVNFAVDDPLRVWLPYAPPQAGDAANQMKLLAVQKLEEDRLQLILEAPAGSDALLHYRASGHLAVRNARILDAKSIRVTFPGAGLVRKKVEIKLK